MVNESDRTRHKVGLRRRESLIDMQADSGEMVNLAAKSRYRKALLQHREFLRDFALKHGDSMALSMLRGLDSPNS